MPIFDTIPNSATTLSVSYRPGQDKRLVASKSEAIFSFGDFTIEKNYSLNYLTADTRHFHFGRFDNLQTLGAVNFSNDAPIPFVLQNELNLPKKNPKSHSYFSSFYTNVATSINKIIAEYPYAILSYNEGNTNIFDYTTIYDTITFEAVSSFKIPISGLTNQGNIAISSATTENGFSLPYDYLKFCIQISGETESYNIKSYSIFDTYLYFELHGFLKGNTGDATYPDAVYIKPIEERIYDYNKSISALEKQLLNDGIFSIPAINTSKDESFDQTFKWPRTIDGFAPDSYGTNFEYYKDKILLAAEKIDDEKTNIFIKTIIPENYLELDSDGQIYRTIIQSYAAEFDKLKGYIDAMAYAHSIEYNDEETVPKKFLSKLSSLLGWKLADGFSEQDLFTYLTSDLDEQKNSFSYFNVEIWKRILVNLVWLYKKKGTRDAITFIFKLLGAPDCLINFNEFIYEIKKTTPGSSEKVDSDGYINYYSSKYVFQQGGYGRGNGDAYINQWEPEFNPTAIVDNGKVFIGDTTGGTRNIINTKEAELKLSPAQAIEHDVFDFYKKDCSCWSLSSTCVSFSSITVPYEYFTFDCSDVQPPNINEMTLAQYIDYVYTNSIDPTARKTNAQCHTSCGYQELKNIYLAYYYATYPKNYNLSMCRLEAYLQLLEVKLGDYITQLVPSTTIFDDNISTSYKNTVFHRQRFVYKEGVDRGSMFRKNFPADIEPHIFQHKINLYKVESIEPGLSTTCINVYKTENIEPVIRSYYANVTCITTKIARLNPTRITCEVNKNSISRTIASVSVSKGELNDMSQKIIKDEILTF